MDLSNFHLDSGVLLASVIWGGLGFGIFIFGKKQRSAPALFGGIALMAITYVISDSALWMSLAAIGILIGIYFWSRQS
jgi:hypothetical protein